MCECETQTFLTDVAMGLSSPQKRIPSKYLYDEKGSALFEKICSLDEYYITRTELNLLEECAPHVARSMGGHVHIVEFGSGSDVKIRALLKAFQGSVTYVPIDICQEALEQSAQSLRADFPHVEVLPVYCDFLKPFSLPSAVAGGQLLGFFPGSTIGNLGEKESKDLMSRASHYLGEGGSFLLGIDLKKNQETLRRAYDDSQGVTAAFSLNLLERMNRELSSDFVIENFEHRVRWNEERGAIEIFIVSLCHQEVSVGEHRFHFQKDEGIHTETSRKYTMAQIKNLALQSGWHVQRSWVDDASLFSVNYLERSACML
ncbi:MAG: L-histidine N(alpha)-methyltransferase [Alphaproteobacteria bacterium GM7ARS4]|nr:L-histidine N(alpha)-methyltransferase [Alphaproteobacteria bacterium GM7ARS4]